MLVRIGSLDETARKESGMRELACDSPCQIDGCINLVGKKGARGMCPVHYWIWKRDGGLVGIVRPPSEDRFWQKVEKGPGCWNWKAAKKENGYGSVLHNGKTGYAHRVSWEMANGPIPAEMLIDHRCFNHACVNPDHLRLVTQKENQENRAGQRSDNTSGYRGVCWKANRWTVEVYHQGKTVYVGRFVDIEDANAAAIAARNRIFTHNDLDRINQPKAA